MDADLLAKYAPVFYLAKDEPIGPCSFESYVEWSSLHDAEHGIKIADPGTWTLADHADDSTAFMTYERAPKTPEDSLDAPLYAVCSTVREGSKTYYSLLYICLFPVGQSFEGDRDKIGQQWCDLAHVRVLVDCKTLKIAKIYFPGFSNSGGWLQPGQATFADSDKKQVAVYVGKGTHTMNPKRGTIWRPGGSQFNDKADGLGVVWNPSPAALPAFVGAWTGELGQSVPTPQQSPWFLKEGHSTAADLLARTLP